MIVVLLYFLSFSLLSSITPNNKKGHNIEVILSFLLLFIFFGFRDLSVLNDTSSYYEHFEDQVGYISFFDTPFYEIDVLDRFEPGFLILEKFIAQYIWANPYSIIVVSTLIITITVIYFFKKYSYYLGLSIFILLSTSLLSQYSGIRQGLGACILMLSYELLLRKKYIIFLLMVSIMVSLHISAIILVLLPVILSLKLNKKNIIIFVTTSAVAILFLNEILVILGFSTSIYFIQGEARDSIALASIFNSIILTVIILFCTYIRFREDINDIDDSLWWITLLNLLFSLFSIQYPGLDRFTIYFYPFTAILLANTLKKIRNSKTRRLFIALVVISFMIKNIVVLSYKREWTHIYPYSFFDFSQKYHDTDFIHRHNN